MASHRSQPRFLRDILHRKLHLGFPEDEFGGIMVGTIEELAEKLG
jgi:hypothetical protein